MPVEKFRSIEEMSAAPVRDGKRNAFDRFVDHCAHYQLIFPRKYLPGVRKFRSLQEAQASRSDENR